MTVVVDLGCYSHPGHQGQSQDSIAILIERYRPEVVYGFDPHPELPEGTFDRGGVTVHLSRSAAWVSDGTVGFTDHGLSSFTYETDDDGLVPCFDFARWVSGRHVVLKANIEGAEYDVLERLAATGKAACVSELLIEWHPVEGWEARKDAILERLTCPVREWTM